LHTNPPSNAFHRPKPVAQTLRLGRNPFHPSFVGDPCTPIDDADLYFQYTRSEGWSLEEGIVKTGSFSIDQGVGVRAVSGEKTAFAYSDDISMASLMDAAHTVRSIAGGFEKMPRPKCRQGSSLPSSRSSTAMTTRSPAWTVPPK
jgi:predicted Zn-dependent protease